ncbi:signal peptidase I [Tepidibacter thalassicus]|uniref:Signal peptidase I n=1 Tax=Tepidibacter thalassicus DSM 15285 TaxID=1123350 RepID=A0A1M5RQ99_9FIRM|nr:signal peptidase I [Tepidibacter thalassicus]SHH28298.1 signal peptidase I [Tepidibacter thalassicus DSM 15285]
MNDKLKKEIIEWVKTIAISLVIAFVITQFIRPTLVKGYSMYPTLEENDYLIINKIPYTIHEPARGDIVVFKSHLTQENGKEKDLVKRVIAVPGDKIKIINGKVYVNGKELKETYINGNYTDGYIDTTVPEGYIFAMGDNRPNSLDSRDPRVGMVSEDDIIGRAFLRLYPFNKIGILK